MRLFQLFILLSTLLGLISCGGGGVAPQTYTTAEAYAEAEGFVGTILVKKNDDYIIRKGFGFSDKNQQLTNTIDTRYRIGSLTKAFTALAIVQLKKANVIASFDDPISNYITNYLRGDDISIRQVLTHRSGIPEHVSSVNPNNIYTPLELVNLFKSRTLEFEPGQKFNYSNSNYVLLGYLIEILSGVEYKNYLQTNIFSALGMVNTKYSESIISGALFAKGYQDDLQTQSANFIDMSIPYSAGAISSSVIDMEIWAESFNANTLVSEQDNLEIFSEGDYGFGWIVTKIAGKLVYTHLGGINGFSSIIAIFPEDNGLIIALSNVEGENAKLERIATAIAENEL